MSESAGNAKAYEPRHALLEDAQARVLAERGYRGASMDEIAARSGVSAPVIALHRESSEKLKFLPLGCWPLIQMAESDERRTKSHRLLPGA